VRVADDLLVPVVRARDQLVAVVEVVAMMPTRRGFENAPGSVFLMRRGACRHDAAALFELRTEAWLARARPRAHQQVRDERPFAARPSCGSSHTASSARDRDW
jgi:hypothetical protein